MVGETRLDQQRICGLSKCTEPPLTFIPDSDTGERSLLLHNPDLHKDHPVVQEENYSLELGCFNKEVWSDVTG